LSNVPKADFRLLRPGLYHLRNAERRVIERIFDPVAISALDIDGAPMAFTPTRNDLLISGFDDSVGILTALAISERVAAAGRPLTLFPLVFQEGRWRDVTFESEHPCHEALRRARTIEMNEIYRERQRGLSMALSQRDDSAAIMDFVVFQNDGRLGSECLWPRSDAYLPKTDRVILDVLPEGFEGEVVERERVIVAWERIEKDFAHLIRAEDSAPGYVRTLGFPGSRALIRS
jgi:hypothetical protein